MKTNLGLLAPWRAVVLIAVLLNPALVWADGNPPDRMTYQGYLTDANGEPLGYPNPKNYDVIFRVWTDASAGEQLWAEQQTLTVDKGYFSVLLGEGSAYGSDPHPAIYTLFTNTANASDRYVEITVKGIGGGATPADVTILPRLRLLTSPYAFLARNAVNAQRLVNNANSTVLNISGNNVGIGKANPTSALDVNGTITAPTINAWSSAGLNSLVVTNNAGVNGTLTAGLFSGSGASLTALNADQLASGSVPDGRLSANIPRLNASNTFTGTISLGSSIRQMVNLWGTDYGLGVQNNTLYYRSGGHFAWYKLGQHSATAKDAGTGGTCLMALDSSGYLGIGNSNPDRPLTIQANTTGGGQWVSLRNSANVNKWGISHLNNGINFAELGVAEGRLFLEPGGNVGIGTTDPTRSLEIQKSGNTELGLKSTDTGGHLWTLQSSAASGAAEVNASFQVIDRTLSATRLLISTNGNVGINTATPAATLHVGGWVKINDMPVIGDERSVQWDEDTKTLGRLASSRRYKENIQPMAADWSALLSAQPVTFTLIGHPGSLYSGFIAEDLDALGLKPLVIYDEAGRPDAIRYDKISLYLLQIAKAQQQELEDKTARIEALETAVGQLTTLVNSLAEKVNGAGQ